MPQPLMDPLTDPSYPEPTPAQRAVLDRIAQQRGRLRAREAAHAQALALSTQPQVAAAAVQAGLTDDSFAVRLATFTRQHPWAVAGVVGLALMAGPRRLVRWGTVALPLIMRLRRR